MTSHPRGQGPSQAPAAEPGATWHTLGNDRVASLLETAVSGLSTGETERRLKRDGPNQLPEAPPTSALVVLLHQFTSPLIYILVAAALVTTLLGEYIDAGVIAFVLALNAGIGFTQERRAEQSVRALMRLMAPRARVIRDGREWEVAGSALVVGDVVLLESGVRVPADLRLFSTTALRIDESLLTGESLPVTKVADPLSDPRLPLADRTNMAFMGSVVTAGRGRGYVTATAVRTELGSIAEAIRAEGETETPLQLRMNHFARLVGIGVGIAAVAAFVIGVAVGERPSHMFMVAVALAVAAIPEGLPVVFTITLALGVRRMARRNAIVRRLPAVETLGSTTIVGSDKTGTLTENRMTVREIWSGGQIVSPEHVSVGAVRERATREQGETVPLGAATERTLLTGVLTNEAELYRDGNSFNLQGDPTEAALLVAAVSFGLEPSQLREAYRSIEEVPFEPDRQYSAAVRRKGDDYILFVKGAPERVLDMSSRMLDPGGLERPLDREVVLAAARDMAGRGLRVLAMASARLPEPPRSGVVPPPSDLTFAGIQGMWDPPREGVREAILGCQAAGIRVAMITGDHAQTALSIGRQLGLASDASAAMTGVELDRLSDDELQSRVADISIYARVAPEQKLRIVQALRATGEVVAVTGDGVNDAPALNAADIGIAMGRSGTDVAREASDMVLADDNFVTIYAAVEEGRITFDNIRKATFFLMSTGAAAILMILVALAAGWPLPMVAAQLLWLNLVTNGLQDVALAFEPGDPGVLERRPRPRDEGIMSRLLWERTALAGLVMGLCTLALFRWELAQDTSLAEAQTVALSAMVLFQMFHVGNCRSESLSAFRKSPLSNPFLLIGTASALAIHVGALYWAPTQMILRVQPIGLEEWVRIVVTASTIILAIELHKLARRPWHRSPVAEPGASPLH